MNQLHFIQLAILKKLLFSNGLRFSELKPMETMENNQLIFHVDQLVKDQLVIKTEDKIYKLTDLGKEYANRMDTDKTQVMRQGKIGAIQCCFRTADTTDSGENEFLIYTRLKQPFYGSQGYPSGKVAYGESVLDASVRELAEETQLVGEPKLFMIEHHRVYKPDTNELLEDKYFYFCRYVNPKGNVIANDEGKFEWVTESQLNDYWVKPFEKVERLQYITKRIKDVDSAVTFEEVIHFAENF